jgi:hypothetical protein
MPYIPSAERRDALAAGEVLPDDSAELNFVICDLLDSYVSRHGLSYDTLKDAGFAVLGAYGEFKQRIIDPYERLRAYEEGEVFRAALEALMQRAQNAG